MARFSRLKSYFMITGIITNLIILGFILYGIYDFKRMGVPLPIVAQNLTTKVTTKSETLGHWLNSTFLFLNIIKDPETQRYSFPKITNAWQWKGAQTQRILSPLYYNQQDKPTTQYHPKKQDYLVSNTIGELVKVNTTSELLNAIKNAKAGQIIELQKGIYTIKQRNIRITKAGMPHHPIILRAQKLGDAQIKLNSLEGFYLTVPFWVFENLDIQGVCPSHNACEHAFHLVGNADSTIIRNNRIYDFNAMIKSGSQSTRDAKKMTFPDHVLLQYNAFFNTSRRNTAQPVTLIDHIGGDYWTFSDNLIADFVKGRGNRISYGLFFKGNSHYGIIEKNLIICNMNLPPTKQHIGIGLSLGGGGTGKAYCRNKNCDIEHTNGIIRHNIIMHCPNDVAIYLNKAKNTQIYNNTIIDSSGIDVRYPVSDAFIMNNIISGKARERNGGKIVETNNIFLKRDRLWTDNTVDQIFINAKEGDFSLKNGAEIIDKGVPFETPETDYCYNTYPEMVDIGAIEYSGKNHCMLN